MQQGDSKGTTWKIDEQALKRFVNGYAYSTAFDMHAKLVRTEDHWMQKIGIAADNAMVDFDADAIAADKAKVASAVTDALMVMLRGDGVWAVDYLAQLVMAHEWNTCTRNRLFQDASAINSANIRWAERRIANAKTVRDGSAVALGVIATVATGGTAAFFLAAGGASGMKGIATYQDTGDATKALGAASLQAFTLGVGPVLGSATKVRVGLTMVAQSTADLGESVLIKGDDLDAAVTSVLVGAGVGAADKLLGDNVRKFIGTRLSKALKVHGLQNSKLLTVTNAPTAFGFTVGADTGVGNRTASLLVGGGGKAAEDKLKGLLAAPGSAGGAGAPPAAGGGACGAGDPSAARREVLARYLFPEDTALLSRLVAGGGR